MQITHVAENGNVRVAIVRLLASLDGKPKQERKTLALPFSEGK